MSWIMTNTTICMSTMKSSRNWKGEWETTPCDDPLWNEIWCPPIPWQHNGNTRSGGGTCGWWKASGSGWSNSMCPPKIFWNCSELAIETRSTWQKGHLTPQDWKLRVKHSRCKRCWQRGSWKRSAAAISVLHKTHSRLPTTPNRHYHTKDKSCLDILDVQTIGNTRIGPRRRQQNHTQNM